MENLKDKFVFIQNDSKEAEAISRPSLSYWQDAWRRFRKNKMAMFFLAILTVVVILTIIGPMISGYGFNDQDYNSLDKGPTIKHWFGTDSLGRDMFTRVWKGARTSLYIGLVGTIAELAIGCLYGATAGYFGGKTDYFMMRVIEILASIPYELLVILFAIVLPPGVNTLILAICVTGWIGLARMIRGQVLQLKESEYVLAARALGASPMRIIIKHLLPNTVGTIIVYMTMDVPAIIFAEAYLSFLSLGITPPNTSWGLLITEGQANFTHYPHELLFPAGALVLAALAFNLIGEGLRDALDPKLRQ